MAGYGKDCGGLRGQACAAVAGTLPVGAEVDVALMFRTVPSDASTKMKPRRAASEKAVRGIAICISAKAGEARKAEALPVSFCLTTRCPDA